MWKQFSHSFYLAPADGQTDRRTDGAVKRSRKQIDPGKEWKLHLVAGAPLCQQESSTSCQAERMHWPAK